MTLLEAHRFQVRVDPHLVSLDIRASAPSKGPERSRQILNALHIIRCVLGFPF
jgi:hypothetical protein